MVSTELDRAEEAALLDSEMSKDAAPSIQFELTADQSPLDETLERRHRLVEPEDSAAKVIPALGMLGRFQLLEVLGQGGFGIVYRARDTKLARHVALKVPRFESTEKNRLKRFFIEGKAAASLDHPNIVAVYETGEVEGKYYIASEYVRGQTMEACMAGDPVPLARAVRWIRALAVALQYAHEQEVVHRDIKPSNVIIDHEGRPKIMDFGLAKRMGDDVSMSTMTADGTVLGTPAYMSPEQARGDLEQMGPASDQYSLGVLMYELLTGRRPYEGPMHVVLGAILTRAPATPTSINPWIPPSLELICQKAMSREPSDRYASLNDLVLDIDHWLAGEKVDATPVVEVIEESSPPSGLPVERVVSALIVLAAVFFITTMIFLVLFIAMYRRDIRMGFWGQPHHDLKTVALFAPLYACLVAIPCLLHITPQITFSWPRAGLLAHFGLYALWLVGCSVNQGGYVLRFVLTPLFQRPTEVPISWTAFVFLACGLFGRRFQRWNIAAAGMICWIVYLAILAVSLSLYSAVEWQLLNRIPPLAIVIVSSFTLLAPLLVEMSSRILLPLPRGGRWVAAGFGLGLVGIYGYDFIGFHSPNWRLYGTLDFGLCSVGACLAGLAALRTMISPSPPTVETPSRWQSSTSVRIRAAACLLGLFGLPVAVLSPSASDFGETFAVFLGAVAVGVWLVPYARKRTVQQNQIPQDEPTTSET